MPSGSARGRVMRPGKVYLVGAGPGAPDLLTLRGLRVLRRADVLVYDRLVDRRLLDEAPRRALRIFAGKTSGHHSLEQQEINALLVEHARRGCRVVRLKGGDPFVFGRGGEEALALARAGIAVEVVPGVMAAGNLPRIIEQLLRHGRSPDTPVALIRSGTTRDEETITGTLGDVLERAGAGRLCPPVTVVIGDVVALRNSLGRSSEWAAGDDMLTSSARVGPDGRHQGWRGRAWGRESGSSARAPSDASWVGS